MTDVQALIEVGRDFFRNAQFRQEHGDAFPSFLFVKSRDDPPYPCS